MIAKVPKGAKGKMKNVELQLLVNGKPVPTYGHDGRTFVEGREGTNFSLRVKNNTARRIEAAVSVDGRSVVDGEAAKPDSRGYIIPAYGSYEIPGWRIDTDRCAKFVFKKGGESYAVKSGSASTDVGVIGLMAWEEKIAPQPVIIREKVIEKYEPWPWYQPYPWHWYTTYTCGGNSRGSTLRGASIGSTLGTTTAHNAGATSLGGTYSACNSAPVSDMDAIPCTYNSAAGAAPSFDLGAGWGDATQSKVTMTTFERGDSIVQTELYYSTAEALEKVGIKLVKEVAVPTGGQYPSAFKFCKPPTG